jgi:hypothetical protein
MGVNPKFAVKTEAIKASPARTRFLGESIPYVCQL